MVYRGVAMPDDGPDRASGIRPRAVLLFYGAMAGIALGWGAIAGRPNVLLAADTGIGVAGQAASGLVVGVLAVIASRALTRWCAWARQLDAEFRLLLGRLTTTDILVMAGGSAIGEEMLFRGAMLQTLGLVPAAFLFGLAHVPPRRELWPWTVWALAAGLLLGKLVEITGSLLGPIIAHFTINWFNLHAIAGRSEEP